MKLSIETKLCECGCGQPAPVATKTDTRRGRIKGQPLRFIRGHNRVPNRYRFSEQDHANGGKRGYKYSDEHKQRIREAKLARGFKGPTFGTKQSVETKTKRRIIAIDNEHHLQRKHHSPHPKGADHHCWNGGGEQYQKMQALERDDHTCQRCRMRDEEVMSVDHIKPRSLFPELKADLENLQTLCANCHARKTIMDWKEIAKEKRMKRCG